MMKRILCLLLAVAFEWSTFAYPADVLNKLDSPTLSLSGPVLVPLGTAVAPSYAFSGYATTGIFSPGLGSGMSVTTDGTERGRWDAGGASGNRFNVGAVGVGNSTLSFNNDVFLERDSAAHTLAMRSGVNAQNFRIYNTFTDASNYERAKIGWSSNLVIFGTEAAGTGSLRNIVLGGTGGAAQVFIRPNTGAGGWGFTAATNFIVENDNTNDIGTPGALRPRDIYVARHFRSEAATVPTMGACGTSPSVTGSDHGATITVGTGGVATSCAMNFGVAFTAAPACVAQNNTDKVAYSIVTAPGSVTIAATAAFTASSKFYVVCMGS
jgi:hypothetical protein